MENSNFWWQEFYERFSQHVYSQKVTSETLEFSNDEEDLEGIDYLINNVKNNFDEDLKEYNEKIKFLDNNPEMKKKIEKLIDVFHENTSELNDKLMEKKGEKLIDAFKENISKLKDKLMEEENA